MCHERATSHNRRLSISSAMRGIVVCTLQAVIALAVTAIGSADAASISKLNTAPTVLVTATNLLGRPVQVAVDASGHLYVLTSRGWIYALSGTLGVLSSARLPPPAPAARVPAVALIVNDIGDVYAATNNGVIYHYSSALVLLGQATVATTTLSPLVGLTIDASGNFYSLSGSGHIVKMNSNLGMPALGTVSVPPGKSAVAIKTDNTGNVYVALSDGTLYRLNTALTTLKSGSVAGVPVNIAADAAGDVFVATSTGLHSINPAITTVASASVTNLIGVDVDSAGNVVAADSLGNVYVTGIGLSPPHIKAAFSPIRAVAIDTTGEIYVVGGPDGASEGDVHLTTIDGIRYDFQSAGEFVLFRQPREEIQVRQFAVATTANTCVSLNGAVAARVGDHKITYEPNLAGQPDPRGLQLRIDRKLTALDASGISLKGGGHIIPTSTPGGLEVDFPDDTVLFVVPGWWPSEGKWYLNVDVVPGKPGAGLIGLVPSGSWLPALPDGQSMGPAPASEHDRYVELYGHFAEAWRVTEKSSLFDYGVDTSTKTFTMPAWPPESGVCEIRDKVRVAGLSEELAKAACSAVPGDPANCIFDVKITGLSNIANTYVASRKVEITEPKPRCACEGSSKAKESRIHR
jgi:hypothetical protein